MVTAVGLFLTEQNPAYRPTPSLFFLDGLDRQMVERMVSALLGDDRAADEDMHLLVTFDSV